MASISSSQALFRSDNPYETLIQSILTIEKQPKLKLIEQKSEYERMQAVLSDFDSSMSGFNTVLESLTDTSTTLYDGRAASTSADAFGVSVSDDAALGTHSLKVERLASTDTRISQQYTAAATTLYDTYQPLGAQTFTISVASEADGAVDGRVDVDVTFDLSGEATQLTDEEVLGKIAEAIDAAMTTAVENGDIKSTERVSASTLKETTDTARLSIQSGGTGFENRLQFTDSAGGLLAALQVDVETTAADATSGGAVVNVGTTQADSELSSKFLLDGLTMYRDGNTVADALTGVTLTFDAVGDAAESFTVDHDKDAVKTEIKSFVSKFNSLIGYIAKKTKIDADEGTRGDFADDSAVRGLRYSLRNDAVQSVDGQPADGPSSLADIGITMEDDGTLKLSDEDALYDAIARDPSAVQSLFSGDDGVATRMAARLDDYLGSEGIINTRKGVYEDRVERMESRITRFDERMARREEQLRQQYARFQESIALLQGQQQTLFGFMGYY